jgi:hypothetical protein
VREEPEETTRCEKCPETTRRSKIPKILVLRKVVIRPADFVKSAFKANGVNIKELASDTETTFYLFSRKIHITTHGSAEQPGKVSRSSLHVAATSKFGENLISLACCSQQKRMQIFQIFSSRKPRFRATYEMTTGEHPPTTHAGRQNNQTLKFSSSSRKCLNTALWWYYLST